MLGHAVLWSKLLRVAYTSSLLKKTPANTNELNY